MQMLQQPRQFTILYDYNYAIRHVRMNETHPARVTPSWYGDSVAHYEGDDWFGTPYTGALHVVERYRLLDYETAKEALERNAKENFDFGRAGTAGGAPLRIDPNYRGQAPATRIHSRG
jgi:hypothetical protein